MIKTTQHKEIPTMRKDMQKQEIGLPEIGMSLDDVIRRGARQVIQQAIEAELAQLLEQYENVKTLHGRRAVVRNGYFPERDWTDSGETLFLRGREAGLL